VGLIAMGLDPSPKPAQVAMTVYGTSYLAFAVTHTIRWECFGW
jgi:hypothetical protein